jgi:putative ABC transport system permease protein
MFDDLKSAVRSLRNARSFTSVALTVLALAIGSATAIFSVVDAVVLRGLPFDEHDRLAVVLEHDTTRPTTFGGGTTTPQMYLDWRRMQESFDGLAAVANWVFRLRTESGEPAEARATRATWELFPALRVSPLLGRVFNADDEIEGRHRVVILSHGFWQRRFGGDPGVVGRTLDLSEETWEIVGVMPARFQYPAGADRPTELYAPLWFRADDRTRGNSRNYNYTVVGRLKPGVTLQQAHEQMNRVAAALDEAHPKWSPGRRARVITLHEHLVGRVWSWMLMLLAAVALVLLIACANVANLMLARATVRAREMGIRTALGAVRWRLVRGLLIEGVVLALAGAAVGLALAFGGVQVLKAWMPAGVPRVSAIAIDMRVLLTAVAAAVATGLIFGMVPALQASRPDLASTLKDSGRSSTAGAGSQRVRNTLVVAEVALAVVLLVGAGLFMGSFVRLMRVDVGIDYRNVLALNVTVPFERDNWREAMKHGRPYVERMLDAVRQVPGVAAASSVSGGLPLTGSWSRNGIELPDRPKPEGDDSSIDTRIVSPGYLELLRVPLLRGRHLNAHDRENTEPVVVVNATAARKYWPGEEALGQRVTINKKDWTVVGVVADVRHLGPESPARQECYMPLGQNETVGSTLVLRTAGNPLAVLPAVKAAIWSVNDQQRLTGDVVTLEGYMDRLIAQRRFNMALLALFGALGLVIAAVGIYGVMAYVVAQRTNEIGVRMALGATPGAVVGMVLGRASLLMLLGLAIGGAGAWYLSAGVRAFLFEVEPTSAGVFAAAIAILAATGLLASAIPARRAARVDPLVALRHE